MYQAGRYADVPAGGGYHLWRFDWAAFSPTRRPMPSLDEVLPHRAPALEERAGPAAAVERVIRRDLGRTWRRAERAAALGSSARAPSAPCPKTEEGAEQRPLVGCPN